MYRFALQNLLSRPVRTALALCGLTVAIAGMVGLFSVAEGIEAAVSATFAKVPGLAVMQPGAPIPLFSRLPARWGEEIRQLPQVHVVHPEVWTRAHVIDGKPTISPPRFLFGSDLAESDKLRYSVYREGLKAGRVLTASDRGTSRTVVSRAIADEFKKEVGDRLRVDGLDLEIVGIYQCNSVFLDVAIILDIELVRRLARLGTDSVCNFYVEPEATADRAELSRRIKELFRGRAPDAWQPTLDLAADAAEKKSPPSPMSSILTVLGEALKPRPAQPGGSSDLPTNTDEPNGADALRSDSASQSPADLKSKNSELPVEVRSSDDWANEFRRFSADLDIFLMLMTAIGVTIAFVGIVNTMLMSVTERFIEFGILKANGWSNSEVLRLIAFESALLGLGGGVVGCVLGWIATHAINARWPTRIHLYASPQLLVFSLCFSTALGVLGGLYPAFRASRMMPMDAIRRG